MPCRNYPALEIDLGAVRQNSRTLCDFCARRGISVAGVIKVTDGNPQVARAYAEGGCAQIASSRVAHLRTVREQLPNAETMLIRLPMISEAEEVVRWCDISLNSEESVLRALNDAACRRGLRHDVILMYDVGDLREGVVSEQALCALARLTERKLPGLHLRGVGTTFACFGGVMPDERNLARLVSAVHAVEDTIDRPLEIVSGGSTVDLPMMIHGQELPPEINHLRLGGSIANPTNLRRFYGVSVPGLREDSFTLKAEVIEVCVKEPINTAGTGLNWAGEEVRSDDRGPRKRAILALGSLDIGDAHKLFPLEERVEILGGSSDHTIVDVTDSPRDWKPGDIMSFRLAYAALLYSCSTRHVTPYYVE